MSNLRMPLANVQSQRIKWTKCDSGWPSSIKSDTLDNVLQACGDAAKLQQRVGIWEHDLFMSNLLILQFQLQLWLGMRFFLSICDTEPKPTQL